MLNAVDELILGETSPDSCGGGKFCEAKGSRGQISKPLRGREGVHGVYTKWVKFYP
jgi:hypothetical protein